MRMVGCVAFGVILLGTARTYAEPPVLPETQPPPAHAHPASACAASSAATHENHTCPTCGQESACASCSAKKQGCISKLFKWMSYRGERPDKACKTCCEPRHPPLYAWFPCQGGECGDCGSCANQKTAAGGLACRLHGLKNCKACNGCPKGQCGAFWFVGRCKVKYPAQACGCGSTTQAAPEISSPAIPAATPPVDPLATPPMLPVQQTASFKQDPSAPAEAAPPKPAAPKRVSTYKPEQMPGAMPVISPEQFRKKPQQ